jgi:hypothetical protein
MKRYTKLFSLGLLALPFMIGYGGWENNPNYNDHNTRNEGL